jgi:hypothetical protein
MRTLITNLTACVLLIVTAGACLNAQEKEKKVNLTGDWYFNLGDNIKYAKPEHDDSDWEKIYVPSSWHDEGFRNYHGYAWYRKKFTIEYDDKEAIFLELGKIDDVDEVYLNGQLVGKTGGFPPDYYTAWNYSRRYHLPSEYLKKGKNVLAVRVYDEGGEGGIMGMNVGIYSYKNFSDNSIHLFGKWKFKLSDDKNWAAENLNDSDWEDVIVPASWESQGFEHYDGFAWYRKTFRLPDNFSSDDMLIILGRIDDMDEVFVNGKFVGGTGRIERKWANDNEFQKYRTYTVPEGLLRPGKSNVIAVRVYDQEGVGGIYDGPITLLPQKEYKDFWRNYRSNSHNNGNSFIEWLSYYFD